jgi:small-conductance mechanosensitive channel
MLEYYWNILEPFSITAAIVVVTIITVMLIRRIFRKLIHRAVKSDDNDPTVYQFLSHLSAASIYIIGFSFAIYTIPELRGIANSVLAGAGIMAVAIGFAAQAALSNVISGLFIIIFRPFRVNDRLNLQDMAGVVEDITLRHTVLRDYENRRIIIPNSIISDQVITNADFKDEKICKHMHFGISYDSNIDLAKRIMQEEALAHPLIRDHRSPEDIAEGAPQVPVRVISLDESSVKLRAWCWVDSQQDSFALSCDLLESIKKRFDAEGIEIPFPYRTLVYKNKPA